MKKTFAMAALIAGLAATGAHADVIYGNDDFEGEALGDFATAPNSTSYVNTADGTGNIDIIAELNSVGDQSADPSGQHMQIRGNANKHITLADPMTLLSDGATSLDVTFKLYFNNIANSNDGRLLYSAAGDFSDEVLIQLFNPEAVPDPVNYLYAEDQWYDVTIIIDPSDVGGAFTDTAKIRFANTHSGAFGDSFIIDDVVLTGVGGVIPEPGSLALLGLGGLLVARRRRG